MCPMSYNSAYLHKISKELCDIEKTSCKIDTVLKSLSNDIHSIQEISSDNYESIIYLLRQIAAGMDRLHTGSFSPNGSMKHGTLKEQHG